MNRERIELDLSQFRRPARRAPSARQDLFGVKPAARGLLSLT